MSEAKRVLIVDDDPDFVQPIRHLLETAGYQVSTAGNGRDGLALAKTVRPDLILLDVMMQDRTEGFFTLEQIRDTPALHATPVIILSSIYSEYPIFRVSPEAGWLPSDLFLPKPIDPARLLAEAARLVARGAGGRRPADQGSAAR